MRILFIDPNRSESFTPKIQTVAEKYALPGTQLQAINPETGPRSIESIYDELLSSPGTLEVALANLDFDAYVIACHSDHPTVYALREIPDKPVLGIAEASSYVACMLGHKFSVVTTNREWDRCSACEPANARLIQNPGIKSWIGPHVGWENCRTRK